MKSKKVKSSSVRQAAIQILIGIALINIADSLNNAGHINWGTFFIGVVGLGCVISGVIDFFKTDR